MRLIGVTGGIASGKSTVARYLGERGATVIDADQLARDVVEPGEPALAAIAEAFGTQMLTADGRLDRAALGALVFRDAAARERLESITHPAVQARMAELLRAARAADPDAVVVYDVPLLVEIALPYDFSLIAVTEAPLPVRIERLMARNNLDRAQAEQRIAAQTSDVRRRIAADVVLDTGGDLSDTEREAARLWDRIASAPRSDVGGPA